MKRRLTITLVCSMVISAFGQNYTGTVVNSETQQPISNVEVKIVEDSVTAYTNANGSYTITGSNNSAKTITFELDGYMFEEKLNTVPQSDFDIELRQKKKSAASLRWEHYMESCTNYNSPNIPDNQEWNVEFKEASLAGDLIADHTYTRRDPSAVIKVNNKYYVWYTYCISANSTYFNTTNPDDKVFPWDYCDVWYATSTDGYTWEEQGPAVERGTAGSFDDRSVFTPEIFAHEGKFYLVYQVVKSPYIERVKNNVAMAVADSPDGPWRKLDEPILRPTNNGVWTAGSTSRLHADKKGDFDSHKVHDPCLVYYKDKFYLYYKGERMGEETYCTQREIKWGVAIADNPEGPYVKSEYNPITNTGHEVSVWPYDNGIAIIQKLDGPERGSIQFAEDGVNFEMKGKATHVPDALGIYRSGNIGSTPQYGVNWGLCHVLNWTIINGGWMYLQRFDIVSYNVSGVDISLPNLTIQIGNSQTLSYTVSPVEATNKNVTWTSSNQSVVTVSANGTINAVGLGSAVVTVKTDDGDFEDSISITVQQDEVVVTKITVEAESFTSTGTTTNNTAGGYSGVNSTGTAINWVNSGDWAEYTLNVQTSGTYQLIYNISTQIDNAEITSYIDDQEVARDAVSNNGQWDAYQPLVAVNNVNLNAGTYTYKIQATGTNEWQWNLEKIEFIKLDTDTVDVTGISISNPVSTLSINNTAQLTAVVAPDNATNKGVEWSTNNSAVATVSNTGLVTGISEGNVNITVTTDDGDYSVVNSISIIPVSVQSVALSQTSMTLGQGATSTLDVTISPSDATNKNVTWISADTSIATVDNNGLVTGVSNGTTTITVTTEDDNHSAECSVTVETVSEIVVQAESFFNTGGTYSGFETHTTAEGIEGVNWVQTGDWGEYKVNIPVAGNYSVDYYVGTVANGAAIEFILNDDSKMTDNVVNNNSWDDFQKLTSAQDVYLEAGEQIIKIKGSGTNGWEWNMDKFVLTMSSSLKRGTVSGITNAEINEVVYPNPAKDILNISGLVTGVYNITIVNVQGVEQLKETVTVDGNYSINISELPKGMYILKLNIGGVNKTIKFSKEE